MEILLPREVTIFPEKIKSVNILLKCIKPTPNSKKSLPVVHTLKSTKLPDSKVKDFWIISLPMQNPYSNKKKKKKKKNGREIFFCFGMDYCP